MTNKPSAIIRPKTRDKLRSIIKKELKKNGHECDLNHIDVSLVTDISYLFHNSPFDGDISKWDVSRAETMDYMFFSSSFKKDVSGWSRSSVKTDEGMFLDSAIAKKLELKNPSFDQVKSYFLRLKLEDVFPKSLGEESQVSKARL